MEQPAVSVLERLARRMRENRVLRDRARLPKHICRPVGISTAAFRGVVWMCDLCCRCAIDSEGRQPDHPVLGLELIECENDLLRPARSSSHLCEKEQRTVNYLADDGGIKIELECTVCWRRWWDYRGTCIELLV